jgi:hypothetical protein
MQSKKINELATNLTPSINDLTVVGDSTTGQLKKIALSQIAGLFGSAGTVSSVATTAPLTGGTITTSGTLGITQATTSTNGYLSSSDFNIFNNKQAALSGTGFIKIIGSTVSYDNSTYYLASNPSSFITLTSLSANTGVSYNNLTGVITSTITQYTDALARAAISLTTTGTSGAATYNSTTGVLNIPQYIGVVTSVFGRTGAVVATSGDYTTTQVTEGTNLYYTDVRARASLIFVAGSGAYNSATGVITIPTNNTQITNGSNYITLSSLSSSATGLTYTNTTGAFSLTAGYVIPTTTNATNWDSAYTNRITSLTTTGTSGAATLTSNTLNIPNYTLAGLGGITLTSLSATSPIFYNSTTGVISSQAASATLSGYLTSTDWTTFNSKGNGSVTSVAMSVPTGLSISGSPITTSGTLVVTFTAGYSIPTNASQTTWDTAYTNRITSLTVTDSSGSATLVSNVLNIPTYTLAGLGGQPLATNLTSLAGLSYVSSSFVKMTAGGTFTLDTTSYGTGTVTSVAALTLGTTGTDLSSSVANSTTTPVITLNVPTASATNRGALSTTDWSTFNGKESVLTFSSPLVRTTNTISIPVATTSVSGYLSSTDWNTFNNKQATISLTASRAVNTGSSGQLVANVTTATELAYLSGVTSNVQTQLDSKYSTSNPTGYITGISSANVISALGYTPYNSSNPAGYITSGSLGAYLPLSGGSLSGNLNINASYGIRLGEGTSNNSYISFYSSNYGAGYEGSIIGFNADGNTHFLHRNGSTPFTDIGYFNNTGMYIAYYGSYSDIRLKNVIETNPDINLDGIDVIKYTLKSNPTLVRYGYSAQQVQSVLPDLVTLNKQIHGNNEDATLMLNYNDLYVLKIAALEKRILQLENKLK